MIEFLCSILTLKIAVSLQKSTSFHKWLVAFINGLELQLFKKQWFLSMKTQQFKQGSLVLSIFRTNSNAVH